MSKSALNFKLKPVRQHLVYDSKEMINPSIFQTVGILVRTSSRCCLCNSEIDSNSEVCEICGEPSKPLMIRQSPSSKRRNHIKSDPFKVRCVACSSECDFMFLSCQICGEPVVIDHYQSIMWRPKTVLHGSTRNQPCRACESLFSCDELQCPICGFDARTCQGQTKPMEWVRASVKVRSPSGFFSCRLSLIANSVLEYISKIKVFSRKHNSLAPSLVSLHILRSSTTRARIS